MPRLYISGPVTGIPEGNRPAFEEAQKELEAFGYAASKPHDFIKPGCPHDEAMFISIRQLTVGQFIDGMPPYQGFGIVNEVRPYYHGVALLDGWEQSDGAKLEKQVAEACGIPCKTVDEWVEEAR